MGPDGVPGARVMRRPVRQRGFSLLEAIVAMVLISAMGGALFAWINTELQALERTQDANTRAEAMVNAVEFMEAVNPMLTPQGKAAFAGLELAWDAFAKAQPGAKPAEQQAFFGAWSKLWGQQVSENVAAERLAAEIHAPGPLRSNVPLSNLPAFGIAYGCKAGTPMQRTEAEQVRIWR